MIIEFPIRIIVFESFQLEPFISNCFYIEICWWWNTLKMRETAAMWQFIIEHWAPAEMSLCKFVSLLVVFCFYPLEMGDCFKVHVNLVHANSLSEEMRWLHRKWRNVQMRVVNYVAIWLLNRFILIGSCTCECSQCREMLKCKNIVHFRKFENYSNVQFSSEFILPIQHLEWEIHSINENSRGKYALCLWISAQLLWNSSSFPRINTLNLRKKF